MSSARDRASEEIKYSQSEGCTARPALKALNVPVSASLCPPASSRQTMQAMHRRSANREKLGWAVWKQTSQGCSEFRVSEPNLLLQHQESDVSLVEMLLRFLHHSWKGERMSTATVALLLCFRAPNQPMVQRLPPPRSYPNSRLGPNQLPHTQVIR